MSRSRGAAKISVFPALPNRRASPRRRCSVFTNTPITRSIARKSSLA
jgi:hypothetical protein